MIEPASSDTYPGTAPLQALQAELRELANLGQQGRWVEGERRSQNLLVRYPEHPEVLHLLGLFQLQQGQSEAALEKFLQALRYKPQEGLFHQNAGIAYFRLEHWEESIRAFETALKHNPQSLEARFNLALALAELGRTQEAETQYRQIITKAPQAFIAYQNLGHLLQQQGRWDEAITLYQQASKLPSYDPMLHLGWGLALYQKGLYGEALNHFERVLQHAPESADARYQVGLTYVALNRPALAAQAFELVLARYADYINAYSALANIYLRQSLYEAAIECYRRGIRHAPQHIEFWAGLVSAFQNTCRWEELENAKYILLSAMENAMRQAQTCSTFNYVSLGLSAAEQFRIARYFAMQHFSKLAHLHDTLKFVHQRQTKPKIRLGYVSGDIRNHPTAHLIRTLFRHHRRDQFEVYLYSIGPADNSIYRRDIPKDCDAFIDMETWTYEACARRIYEDKIDILIDLMGYTQYSRTTIFELKPAPIQISYLGYPGTMGTDFIDYLVSDKLSIPPAHQAYFSEKLLYLPHTYFVTDDAQPIADTPTRQDCGLPEHGFVFCCFNRSYKLEPQVFSIWMRLLKAIPDSVLWLYSDIPEARPAIWQEAEKEGVAASRVLFAETLPKAEHLARLRLADLFLDCFQINAHTTAIDALWAGVPVVTCPGNSLIARASSSIVYAAGLPELIATNADEYYALAYHYATDPKAHAQLKTRWHHQRLVQPLFNTALYVQHLEAAFQAAWQRYLRGEPAITLEIV